jgi:hypothetical protein
MITQEDIDRSKLSLEKLAFTPGMGSALWQGTKAVGKMLGSGASKATGGVGRFLGDKVTTIHAASKLPAEGKLGAGLAFLSGLGLVAGVTPGGDKVLDSVPGGAIPKFLNPYSAGMISPDIRIADRYKGLDPNVMKKSEKSGVLPYSNIGSVSRSLADQPRRNYSSFRKKASTMLYSKEEIRQYKNMQSKIEKTAAVKSLKRIIGKASDKGNFARQALAYMAGATALGVAAPMAASAIGGGINFARRGRLNRDYNSILEVDPELKHEPSAKQYFEVLHRASPYVATEPVIAATVVRNLVDSPGLDSRKFQEILELEKMRQHTSNPMLRDQSGISRMVSMPHIGMGE